MSSTSLTNEAFGHPGIEPKWTSARKDAVGTAYSAASRLWFTIWRGILTEVYYPTIDRPQVRDLQFLVSDGETFFHEEKRDMSSSLSCLSNALGYEINSQSVEQGYQISKTVIADPHCASLLIHVNWKSKKPLKLYVLCAPHLGGGGFRNNAYVTKLSGHKVLSANHHNTWMSILSTKHFSKASVGFVGASDGWTDLARHLEMKWQFDSAREGNVALLAEIPVADNEDEFVLSLSFGHSLNNSCSTALQSLAVPFQKQSARFVEQWQRAAHWDDSLADSSGDNGKLFQASCKILMAHEDKLNPGAMIASLSIPWGEAKGDDDAGGYHLVWPRDLCNSASGLLAAGNTSTALRSLFFLAASQKDDGSFPQNFWISGESYWSGLQLDELSFPILLVWRLLKENLLSNFDPLYFTSSAMSFLIRKGPVTAQERWEEVSGFSPSTLAVNIAALVCAGQIFRLRGLNDQAKFVEEHADYLRAHIEEWTVTDFGEIHPDVSRHFIRANPCSSLDNYRSPNDSEIFIANRRGDQQQVFRAKDIVDAGFLELVRYGIYPASHSLIKDSLLVIDQLLKVETNKGSCWRRYNNDGYGQGDQGEPFVGTGVGRPWPLLIGERAHYELALGKEVTHLIKAMENFSAPGGPIPEQIWDAPDLPSAHLKNGGPTGSAMPLAWAHAEYLKLLRSVRDKKVYDFIPEVADRYCHGQSNTSHIEIWRFDWQITTIAPSKVLRIICDKAFHLHWSNDDWDSANDSESINILPNLFFVDLPAKPDSNGFSFTFFCPVLKRWAQQDFMVRVEQS
jgi:glucoamylase